MSRKEKMKVYHGIPKSPTDEHTIFYADLDGNVNSSMGNLEIVPNGYYQMPTGYGISVNTIKIKPISISLTELTMECFIKTVPSTKSTGVIYLVKDGGENNSVGIYITSGGKLSLATYDSTLSFEGSARVAELYSDFTSLQGVQHIRVTVNRYKYCFYLNGKLTKTGNMNGTGTFEPTGILIGAYKTTSSGTVAVGDSHIISDVHISNIDRGDYFPTLPQDFIEGKAIIKERLGQQQIKGDPLISQVTELKVPSQSVDMLGKIYDLQDVDSDRLERCFESPELRASNCHTWETNLAKIRIEGLNNEVISGVIDSDTFLCRTLNNVSFEQNVNFDVKVTTTTGLSVGDTLKLMYDKGNIFTVPDDIFNVVAIVDSTTVTLKCTNMSGSINSIDYYAYLIENTTSSSSPIVKTTDGTVVNGTWTGLGTNVATFTLGTNTGLSGKDLVVTYSLNIPQGNSHFPELPSDIERAYTETGIEMKPVSEIVIEDDFESKLPESTKECPHIVFTHIGTTIKLPSQVTGNYATGFQELSNANQYVQLSTLDGILKSVDSTANGGIPQQLFKFNLIEIIERKIGNIPSRDKVQWLKENLSRISVQIYAYGSCPNGNKVQLQSFNKNGSTWGWTTNYINPTTSNTPTINKYDIVSSGAFYVFSNTIYDDGCVYSLLTTDPSDGTTSSVLYIDYACIKVTLKSDSTFTMLYCDNRRAREDSCNPVLIQKETKTVKRYIPSKECFVTEYSYVTLPVFNDLPTYVKNGKKVSSHGKYYLSSLGTGKIHNKYPCENLGQLLNKKQLYKYSGDNILEVPYTMFIDKGAINDYGNFFTQLELVSDPNVPVIQGLLATKTTDGYLSGHGKSRGISSIPKLVNNPSEYYGLALTLYEYNKEICMLVTTCSPEFDVNIYNKTPGLSHLYKLPNRPLIK